MANIIDKAIWQKTGVDTFSKLLDLSAFRHKLISGNIANATTPGYASKDFDFDDEMQKAMGDGPLLPMMETNSKHIGNVGPDHEIKVVEHEAESDEDLNGVDIDTEVTNLAVNEMRYSIGARILERKLTSIKKAITGRSG